MDRLRENQIAELAQKIAFPPLKIVGWQKEPRWESSDAQRRYRPDAVVEIRWENKPYLFVAEMVGQASPKTLQQAIAQVKTYISVAQTRDKSTRYYPLLIAPYLSQERLELLTAEQVSGFDLSGNGVVVVPGKLFVYRSGAVNNFPSNAPIKNVFRGVSSIVPRVFFAKPQFETVSDVFKEIGKRSGRITFATVSKVLKTMEEEFLIARTNESIRLLDGKGLLKNLRENYRRPSTDRTLLGKVADLAIARAQMTNNADKGGFLYAIDEPNRYTVIPSNNTMTRLYTQDMDRLLMGVKFDQTERFANLKIIETQEQTVYFDRRVEPLEKVFYTSPLQVYLELASGGKREAEMAEQIAGGLLNFKY